MSNSFVVESSRQSPWPCCWWSAGSRLFDLRSSFDQCPAGWSRPLPAAGRWRPSRARRKGGPGIADLLARQTTPPRPRVFASALFADDEGADADNAFARRRKAPSLDGGVAWINTGGPIDLKQLRGKFVLLDFWTYCCINCMHILPVLKKLEHAFPNELVVIGVHSAKFEAEQDSKNITDAVLRYDIEHPVINDRDHKIVGQVRSHQLAQPAGDRSGRLRHRRPQRRNRLRNARTASSKKRSPTTASAACSTKRPSTSTAKPTARPIRHCAFPARCWPIRPTIGCSSPTAATIGSSIAKLDGTLIDDNRLGRGRQRRRQLCQGLVRSSARDGRGRRRAVRRRYRKPSAPPRRSEKARRDDVGRHRQTRRPLAQRADGRPRRSANRARRPSAAPGRCGFTAAICTSPWPARIKSGGWSCRTATSGPTPATAAKTSSTGRAAAAPYEEGFASFAQPSGLTGDDNWLYVADSEGSSIRAVPFDPNQEVRDRDRHRRNCAGGRLFTFGDVDGQWPASPAATSAGRRPGAAACCTSPIPTTTKSKSSIWPEHLPDLGRRRCNRATADDPAAIRRAGRLEHCRRPAVRRRHQQSRDSHRRFGRAIAPARCRSPAWTCPQPQSRATGQSQFPRRYGRCNLPAAKVKAGRRTTATARRDRVAAGAQDQRSGAAALSGRSEEPRPGRADGAWAARKSPTSTRPQFDIDLPLASASRQNHAEGLLQLITIARRGPKGCARRRRSTGPCRSRSRPTRRATRSSCISPS